MALDFFKFLSERDLGDWVLEHLEESICNAEMERSKLPLDIIPTLAAGYSWAHEGPPEGGRREVVEVFRELSIPNANGAGRGPAPADLVLCGFVEDLETKESFDVHIIIELKDRPVKARDFGQLSRYMRGYREAEVLYPTRPSFVFGVLLGDGAEHEAKALAESVVGVAVVDLVRFENEIWGAQIVGFGAGSRALHPGWFFDPRHPEEGMV